MKTLLVLLLTLPLIFLNLVYAQDKNPSVCFTDGQCQERLGTIQGTRPILVKMGDTCALRHYYAPLGARCEFLPNSIWGICQREKFQEIKFDPQNPDCTKAIDAEEAPSPDRF